MRRGPKPVPTALRRAQGNPGKRAYNHDEPVAPKGLPTCPGHLSKAAQDEWDRLAQVLHEMGVVTLVDRAALAAYCQCYGRWVEAEEKLQSTPMLLKTATGYVQQSPWLSISNKQLELMGRYMTELGLTPAARSRIVTLRTEPAPEALTIRWEFLDPDGTVRDRDGNVIPDDENKGYVLPGIVTKL
jgi:P27 family predicted phage terminase small subunit